MRSIPLNLLTLYADLLQGLNSPDAEQGSISTRVIKGRPYLYLTTKDGGLRVQRSLGPAGNEATQEAARAIRHATSRAKHRRTTVSALKSAGIPAPSLVLGRILEAAANAHLFNDGLLLIGTGAYQIYPCIVGAYLSSGALLTLNAGFFAASFINRGVKRDMGAILKRADPTFEPVLNVNDSLPKVFRASNTFEVDILTRYGRGRKSPVPIAGLSCAAEALTFMEYIGEETMDAVALYNTGVIVKVPPPIRFAIHKLLVAQEGSKSFAAKKAKDLAQAREVIDILIETDGDRLQDELDDARERGPRWKKGINTSLKELRRDTRQGYPPVQVSKPLP